MRVLNSISRRALNIEPRDTVVNSQYLTNEMTVLGFIAVWSLLLIRRIAYSAVGSQ